MQPDRRRHSKPPNNFQATTQLSFIYELFGNTPPEDTGNIISFDDVTKMHRMKMERKAFSIILNNIKHLKDRPNE